MKSMKGMNESNIELDSKIGKEDPCKLTVQR